MNCDREKSKFIWPNNGLGGGFKYFLFSPLPGEMIQFDEHIFQMGWNHQLVAGSCYISYLKEISYMFHVSSIPLFGSLLDIGAWNSRAMSRLSSQRELSKSPTPADFKLSPSPNIKNTKTNKQTATMTMMWTRVSSLSGTYATFETYANDGPDHLGFAQNALHRYRLTFIANDHQSHEAKIFGSRGSVCWKTGKL